MAATEDAVLRVEDLEHRYTARPILRGVTLSIGRGERVALMGPSGSGKSTLLNCILGIERPQKGGIFIEGQALGELDELGLDRMRREQVTMVFQSFHLLPTLSAFENVELPLMLAGVPGNEREERVRGLLDETGVAHRADALPSQLSGGEKQRVAIARALAPRPALVLADEPTGSLDRETGARVLRLLREVSERHATTLLVVTHDPETAQSCERTLSMVDGIVS